MRPAAFWFVAICGLVSLGRAVTGYEDDPCSRSHNVVTCDTRDDAAESGASEARAKGLAGACVEPRRKYAGDGRYVVSLTFTDCDRGQEFVAASP